MRLLLLKTGILLLLCGSLQSQARQQHTTIKKKGKTAVTAQFKAPEFPGGKGALRQFLDQRIKYPNLARENEIQGIVLLTFFINEQGMPEDIQVTRDIGGGCGTEAVRVVQQMPAWTPGSYAGRKTRMWYELSVYFMLR